MAKHVNSKHSFDVVGLAVRHVVTFDDLVVVLEQIADSGVASRAMSTEVDTVWSALYAELADSGHRENFNDQRRPR